jgi:hypothetical protein
MSFFANLLESIGLRKRGAHVGLRPHREIVTTADVDVAHDHVVDAFDRVLGANVYVDDRATHTIEGGFGTINQERLRVTLERVSDAETRIAIEAHYPVGTTPRSHSLAVDTLAQTLSSRA